VNVNVADRNEVGEGGPERMAVSGGSVSGINSA
jgi:uncharacterized protein YodC (DUF2158 family)